MHGVLQACFGQSVLAIRNANKQFLIESIAAVGGRSASALAVGSQASSKQDSSVESILASASDVEEPNAASLVHFHSATSNDDIVTVAGQCGAKLTGQELRRLKEAFSASAYPAVPKDDLLYPPGVIEDIQMQVIRRHNLSMPCKHNQRVYGTVYAHNEDRAWVDVGHSALAIFKRTVRINATPTCITHQFHHTVAAEFHQLMCVQELMVSNLAPPKDTPVEPREHAHDIRVGDRFIFRIQELKCPLGSVWLEPQNRSRSDMQAAVWEELKRHHTTGEPVGGRILNDINGGLAVGIAGVVALLPWDAVRQHSAGREMCRKLGSLQPFVVTSLNAKYRECFLRFPATEQRRRFDRHG